MRSALPLLVVRPIFVPRFLRHCSMIPPHYTLLPLSYQVSYTLTYEELRTSSSVSHFSFVLVHSSSIYLLFVTHTTYDTIPLYQEKSDYNIQYEVRRLDTGFVVQSIGKNKTGVKFYSAQKADFPRCLYRGYVACDHGN